MEDRVGRVVPGMLADLLVVDGNPLADLEVLGRPERVPMIMKAGRVYRDRLDEGSFARVGPGEVLKSRVV